MGKKTSEVLVVIAPSWSLDTADTVRCRVCSL